MADDTIEIEYQLTVDDYAKFSADRQLASDGYKKSKKTFFKVYVVFCAFIVITNFFSAYNEYSQSQNITDVYSSIFTVVLSFCLLSYLLYFFTNRKKRHQALAACMMELLKEGLNKVWFSESSLVLSQSSVLYSCEYAKSEHIWDGIEKIEILDGDFCIFVSSISAFVIPSRFFESEEEKQRIYEQCVAWHKAAQGETLEDAT